MPIKMCEECDVEMEQAGPSLDTGKEYFYCPECGWSEDID
jgi:Zn-finger nucleic acid-binding protein